MVELLLLHCLYSGPHRAAAAVARRQSPPIPRGRCPPTGHRREWENAAAEAARQQGYNAAMLVLEAPQRALAAWSLFPGSAATKRDSGRQGSPGRGVQRAGPLQPADLRWLGGAHDEADELRLARGRTAAEAGGDEAGGGAAIALPRPRAGAASSTSTAAIFVRSHLPSALMEQKPRQPLPTAVPVHSAGCTGAVPGVPANVTESSRCL